MKRPARKKAPEPAAAAMTPEEVKRQKAAEKFGREVRRLLDRHYAAGWKAREA